MTVRRGVHVHFVRDVETFSPGFNIRIFITVNKAKVIKRQSVFDRLGKESPPLKVALKEPEKKKTEVKTLKPLKTSVTVQMKVRIAASSTVMFRISKLAFSSKCFLLLFLKEVNRPPFSRAFAN